jgi:hypothetical protein
VSGSIQQSDANGTSGSFSAFGQLFEVQDDSQTFSFSGHLQPGNGYTISAFIQGDASIIINPDRTVSGQSSSGSFDFLLELATVEIDCGNGVDDDGDGLVDGNDPDCAAGVPAPALGPLGGVLLLAGLLVVGSSGARARA